MKKRGNGEGTIYYSDKLNKWVGQFTAGRKDDGKLKAVASVSIDNCFVVHDVKILEGNEDYFIAMPSKKTPEGEYKDIVHPLNTETREMIKKAVLDEFEKVKATVDEQAQ